MRFSAYPGASIPWDELLELATHLEATNWDGIWFPDHFMPNQEDPVGQYREAWTTLAAIAASVPRVRIGVLVSGITYRHPAVLAKMAAQVDIISGGRLVLGLGAAHQQNEHFRYGIPFYTLGQRLRRLEEACQVIRSMFEHDKTTFEGRYYQLWEAPLCPKPRQLPRPSLLIGGGGERVTMRIAAQYADEWNVFGTPEEVKHKITVLEHHCSSLGRDPSEIRRSACATFVFRDAAVALDELSPRTPVIIGDRDELKHTVQKYADAGIDELVFSPMGLGNAGDEREEYDRWNRDVVPGFR